MTRRLIPLLLFALITVLGQAQRPETIKNLAPRAAARSMACPPGVSSEAGTLVRTMRPGSQSNDILFLEFGDTLDITHNQDWFHNGDPDGLTDPGIGYIFYKSNPFDPPPGISGPELADIEADTNLLLIPPPPNNPNFAQFYAYTDATRRDGTTFFWNDGTLQTTFNGGDPVQIWYAPVTIDDFFGSAFEPDGSGTRGGCIDVNVDAAFSVYYLNVLDIENITPMGAGNGCAAEIVLTGGQPEVDGSNYDIDISLSTDNTIKGEFVSAYSHGDTMNFWVNIPGVYTVTITDDIGGTTSLDIDMTSCIPVSIDLPDTVVIEGDVVCVQIKADGFTDVTSAEIYFEWDNSIVTFNGLQDAALGAPELFFGPPSPMGFMVISWNEFTNTPISHPDGTILFEICFHAVGTPGQQSPFDFFYNPPDEDPEFAGANDFLLGFSGNDGTITIISSTLMLDLFSCGGLANPAPGNGTLTGAITGGTAPYSYDWVRAGGTPNGNGNVFMPNGSFTVPDLPPGDYTVSVTDATGQLQIGMVTVADENPMRVTLAPRNPRCSYTLDGDLTANVTNGTGPYTYAWSNSENGVGLSMITGLRANDYMVTVTDALGCTKIANETLGPDAITVNTVTLDHVTCASMNGDDGQIIIGVTGGRPDMTSSNPYTYEWSIPPGGMDSILTNLTPGDYTVTVTDVAGCADTVTYTVNDAVRPSVVSWDSISVQCPGDMSGSLTVNAQSPNAAITGYTWSVPGSGPTITGLNGGRYFVTITAADGCEGIDSIDLVTPTPITQDSVVIDPPICPEDIDGGAITVFTSGGNPPYTYVWSTTTPFDTTTSPRRSGLFVDTVYNVIVFDASGCQDTLRVNNVMIPAPPEIAMQDSLIQDASCADGVCDGAVLIRASGGTAGTGNYTFSWDGGPRDEDVVSSTKSDLCAGWTQVTITDGSNCAGIVDSVFVGSPDPVSLDLDSSFTTTPSCTGDMDGEATVKGSGGTPAYTYLWSFNNSVQRTITGLSAGFYTVTITDMNGCSFVNSFEVTDPPVLVAAIDSTTLDATRDVTCNGDSDGQITADPSGGTAPYTYAWPGGISNSNFASGLAAGLYTVTVTDANGCTDEVSHEVVAPPPLTAIIPTPAEPQCFGDRTAIIVDTAFGGDGGPYTFSVDGGPAQFIDGGAVFVLAGDHIVTVRDFAGCEISESINIGQPSAIVVSLGDDTEIQLGESAIIEANVGSNLGVDTVIWTGIDSLVCLSPDCQTVEVFPLSTSPLELTVFDPNGCTGSDDMIVEVDRNRNVYIPNVFSPNQDGTNDMFQVFLGPGVRRINSIRVFDRWGGLQFFAENIDPAAAPLVGWNGISSNGDKMNIGVYVYLVEVEFVDDRVLLYRGDVTLVR